MRLLIILTLTLTVFGAGETNETLQEKAANMLAQARLDDGVLVSQEMINMIEVGNNPLRAMFLCEEMLNHVTGDEVALTQRLARARALARDGEKRYRSFDDQGLAKPDAVYQHPNGMMRVFAAGEVLRPGLWVDDDRFVLTIDQNHIVLEQRDGARTQIPLGLDWPETNAHLLWARGEADTAIQFLANLGHYGLSKAADLTGHMDGWFRGDSILDLIDSLCQGAELVWQKDQSGLTIGRNRDGDQYNGFLIDRMRVNGGDADKMINYIIDQVGLSFEDPQGLLAGKKLDMEINKEPWDKVLDRIATLCEIKLVMTSDQQGNRKLVAAPLDQ